MSIQPGTVYVVATPIGNLDDITQRAIRILSTVDRIAAEDTRHSAHLLRHYAIDTPCIALHEHNEERVAERLLEDVQRGSTLALISDAGTPLVSDPGFRLVRLAQQAGIKVVPIPGPSACLAALSAAGLPCDRFSFEGFLPAKSMARRKRLESLSGDARTLVFYEAPHRIEAMLEDLAEVFGEAREAVLARELTKTFETIRLAPLAELRDWVKNDPDQRKGEIVVLVRGAGEGMAGSDDPAVVEVLDVLLEELPLKQAAALTAKITGAGRNEVYKLALQRADIDKS